MTEEVQTKEAWFEIDYTDVLDDIRSELQTQTEIMQEMHDVQAEQSEYIQTYLPELFKVSWLFLGAFIAVTLFRWLLSFLGKVFNDTTKL